jgi:hypothetical protein
VHAACGRRLPGQDSVNLIPSLKVRANEKLGGQNPLTAIGGDRKVSIPTTSETSLTKAQDTAGSQALPRCDPPRPCPKVLDPV